MTDPALLEHSRDTAPTCGHHLLLQVTSADGEAFLFGVQGSLHFHGVGGPPQRGHGALSQLRVEAQNPAWPVGGRPSLWSPDSELCPQPRSLPSLHLQSFPFTPTVSKV